MALGSVIKSDAIQAMGKTQEHKQKLERIGKQIEHLNSEIKELEKQIAQENVNATHEKDEEIKQEILLFVNNLTEEKDSLVAYRISLYKERAKLKLEKIETLSDEILISPESPIDHGASKFEVQIRGHDSLSYSSHYINKTSSLSGIMNQMDSAANSSSTSLGGRYGLFYSASVSRDYSKKAVDRIAQIQKEDLTEGTLVINAFMTSRNVRCYTDLKYDKDKLISLRDAMLSTDETTIKASAISSHNGQKAIYMLTEEVLGGAFTALVTFLKVNQTQQEGFTQDGSEGTKTNVSGGFQGLIYGARGEYGNQTEGQNQGENDFLKNTALTNIRIEMFTQGAIPIFAREVIKSEASKYLNLSSSTQNTPRQIVQETQYQKVHTMESVMAAYDNFSEQMTADKGCGMPIGFNYRILTKADIDRKLKDMGVEENITSESTAHIIEMEKQKEIIAKSRINHNGDQS